MSISVSSDHTALRTALDWLGQGRRVAVARVVETWGSAPRAAGSLLIMDDAGAMEGSVSGGCVEGAVMAEAQEALDDGAPRLLDYGVSDDDAFAVGLACGGRIRVLVEPVGPGGLPLALLERILARQAAKQPVAYVVNLLTWARDLAGPETYPERFRLDRSGVEPDGRTFVAVQNPPLRMIIVGAVHIAQALVPMARACGFDPVLVDPRGAFGSAARFPGERILEDWPDEAVTALAPDRRTAVVTLTHDSKLDDPAIRAALASEAFYLGCLGSTRTHAKRVARLSETGTTAAQIARIHAPVGLDIGGRQPAEIAVSIMAQIIAILRRGA